MSPDRRLGHPGEPGLPGKHNGGTGGAGGAGGDAPRQRPVVNAIRWLIVATILLYCTQGAAAIFFYIDAHKKRDQIARVAHDVNKVLCIRRDQALRQIRSSQQFLLDHPNGIPGISRKVILRGIHDQQLVLDSVQGVKCPPPPLVD